MRRSMSNSLPCLWYVSNIKLDSTSVPFGAVVRGSGSSRVVIMQNLGDIGARFSWNMNEFSSDFSVEPVKGYSSPGSEVSFELKFCPQKVSQDIRSEVSCKTIYF